MAWGTQGSQNTSREETSWAYVQMVSPGGIYPRGLHWVHVAQDRDQGRIIVDTVMNLRVP
jgi:hypothetical protein